MPESPIFVIGTGRSGTTLLRFMLCAHPRIYITHEASFYLFEKGFRPRGAPVRQFLDYYFQTPSFRWLRVDPARVLALLPESPTRADGSAAVMRAKAEQYGRLRCGDKTPSHSGNLKQIFADFPDARVVHIVRDPRGCSLSLSRMPWASPSLWANAVFCKLESDVVAKYRGRFLQIRLEDLLADPRATMGRVLEHVGEPWDDAVLDHARNIPDKHDMPPLPWLESAARERGTPEAKWTSLSPLQIRVIERAARKVMREAGYEPARLAEEPSRLAVWWAALREIPEMLRTLGILMRIARLGSDPRNFESAESRALWRRLNPPSWAHYPGFEIPDAPPLALPAPPRDVTIPVGAD
jgi:hypothetical protein